MKALSWYDWILLIISILLILIIVLQSSKDDIGNTFSGEKSELFSKSKARGPEKVVNYITLGLSVLFFIFSVLAAVLPRY